jgi:hypothetical protein
VEVSVSISEDAQSWITQVQTRGLETRTLYFDIAPYDGDATREGTITISGGNATQTINICQFSWQTLEDNKIYYTSSDGQIVEPYSATSWGDKTSIISNTYENGQGVIVFSRNLTEIGSWAFQDNGNKFTSITLPKTLKKIGYQAFLSCSQLTEIEIPNSVTSIGTHAFASCTALTEVTLGENLETIGDTAFIGCAALTNITIPDKVKSIGSESFKSCANLTELTLGVKQNKIVVKPAELLPLLTVKLVVADKKISEFRHLLPFLKCDLIHSLYHIRVQQSTFVYQSLKTFVIFQKGETPTCVFPLFRLRRNSPLRAL